MGLLTQLAANIGAPPFGDLVGMSVKAALVLLGALVVTALLRRASASMRHHVWAVALLSVLALPAIGALLPAWNVPVLPSTTAAVQSATNPVRPATGPEGDERHRGDDPARTARRAGQPSADDPILEGDATASAPLHETTPTASDAQLAGSLDSSSARTSEPERGTIADTGAGERSRIALQGLDAADVAGMLLGSWLLGVVFFLGRLAASAIGACWLVRRAEPVRDADVLGQADDVRDDLGIGSPVRIVMSDRTSMPMAWGIFRPTVVLPGVASEWSAERRRVVLLHEMAHLKRRDCQTLLLARLVTALHWFNPLAWTATRRLQAERERACDDLVLSSGTPGADYAQHLLDIARAMRRGGNAGWATVAMARPSELEGRLLAILDPKRRRDRTPRLATVVVVLVTAGAVLPLAALQPSAVAQQSPQEQRTEVSRNIATEIDAKTTIRQQLAVQVQRQLDLQLEVQPRITAELKLSLPEELAAGYAAGAAQGLAAGLGEALAGGVVETARQEQGVDARVMEAFMTALRDENAGIRAQAANSLGMLESDEAVAALSDVLRNDADADVRSQAAWALGMIESDAGVPALVDAVADGDAEVRSQAAWALGMIESPDGVSPLSTALSDADDDVRSQAAWALGMIEDATAVEALSDAVRNDASVDVRRQAAWALGMIEDEAGIEPLLDALTDEDLEVRKTALWAVGQISG